MAELEGDDKEFEHLDEDYERRVQRHIVDEKVIVVVGGAENVTAKETGGTATAQRGVATASLRTR